MSRPQQTVFSSQAVSVMSFCILAGTLRGKCSGERNAVASLVFFAYAAGKQLSGVRIDVNRSCPGIVLCKLRKFLFALLVC